jgi:hypothetical protein
MGGTNFRNIINQGIIHTGAKLEIIVKPIAMNYCLTSLIAFLTLHFIIINRFTKNKKQVF